MNDIKEYKYTYRLRGYSIGCQPKQGFIKYDDNENFKYGIIYYDRKLTSYEIEDYELIDLNI